MPVPAQSFSCDLSPAYVMIISEFLKDINQTAYVDLSGQTFISYIDTGLHSYYSEPQNLN